MQQVFINLLRNALDAGADHLVVSARRSTWGDSRPDAGASLAGAVAEMRDDRPVTVIRIRDDGPGIRPEALPHVFDPFFTTRGMEQGDAHGVGLGLYVVEEIVAEHGACVAAETLPTGGARFTLWLPCRMQEENHA
jgi:signal transduction histidine kinase